MKREPFLKCACGDVTTVLFDGRCLTCARIWLTELPVQELADFLARAMRMTGA